MSRQARGKRGGTLRLKEPRQMQSGPTRSVHGWTVIKIDTNAYLVQTPSGHDGVEVDVVAGTCTGSDRQCALTRSGGGNVTSADCVGSDPQSEDSGSSADVNRLSRGQHRQLPPEARWGGCVHVRAAAMAVKFGTALRRLDWRRSLARLRETRAAAAASASAARDDEDETENHQGPGEGWSQRNMFARDEPTPLEVKMRKWEQRRQQGFRFTARDPTDSATEDDDDDDDGFSAAMGPGVAAGKRRPTPPFRGKTPPPPSGASPQSHAAGRGDGVRDDAAHQTRPAPPSEDTDNSGDGGNLFDAFVSKWNRFIKGDVAVTSLARVPFPTDVELDEMIPIALPSHRKRTRLRQLLLLLHPDKATSKLSERLPPTVKEPVWTRLKELSQKLTELGRVIG